MTTDLKYVVFFGGVRAWRACVGARGENILLFKLSVVRFGGRRRTEEEDAVFVRLTGGKAQVWLRLASPL